jgi:dolichol-phosphate mannosyltransferase
LSTTLTVVVPGYNERANVAPMVKALDAALAGLAWEVVFVDDDSPDGTAAAAREIARTDPRVRCIRRVGRRGLSSAVIEGALSSSADYVAVIDGDLQHDETRLPLMLEAVAAGADMAVGSRHVEGGDSSGLSSPLRVKLSETGIRVAQLVTKTTITDPMSPPHRPGLQNPAGPHPRLAAKAEHRGNPLQIPPPHRRREQARRPRPRPVRGFAH